MKKFLIGLLTLVLCFTLVGCGSNYENNEAPNEAIQVDEDYEEDPYAIDDNEYIDYGDFPNDDYID